MVCTLAVTQALNRHRKTQLFLWRDSAAPTLKYRWSLRTRLRVCCMLTGRDDSCKCRLRLQQSALDSFSATKWRQGPCQQPAVLFHFYGPRSVLEAPNTHTHPTLTDRPTSGCTAAPTFGSLGSAAKVNNECIFHLHIFKLFRWWRWYLVFRFFVNNPGEYGRCVSIGPQTGQQQQKF